jgi:hypothetical protein
MDFADLVLEFLRDNGYTKAHISHGHYVDGQLIGKDPSMRAVQIGLNMPNIVIIKFNPITNQILISKLENDSIGFMRFVTNPVCNIADPTALDKILANVKNTLYIM